MAETLAEEQYAGDRQVKLVLEHIPKFTQEYTEPRMMVRDGIRVARVAETFAKNMLKIEWSVGNTGTHYHALAADFGNFLIQVCHGEMKYGAAPLSANERILSGWLSDNRSS